MWGLGKSNFSVAYKHEHIAEKIIRGKKDLLPYAKPTRNEIDFFDRREYCLAVLIESLNFCRDPTTGQRRAASSHTR